MPLRVLYSAHPDYLDLARRALEAALPEAEMESLGGVDVALLHIERRSLAEVADVCRATPIPFVRHLAAEDVRVPTEDVPASALERLQHHKRPVGLQVWASGPVQARAEGIRASISERLATAGIQTVRRDAAEVLAVCATPAGVSMGITDAASMLCDWPGGRVRLRAGPEQISRSEFKLEELIQLFPLDLRPATLALDLGASPGGWTRILRTYAVDVVAVDPGDLDRRLRADEGIRHERMTAGNYLRSSTATFDLVVNDLRMDAERSARLMVDAAGKLNPGGRAVVTLKVTPRTARQDLAGALRLLSSAYELLFARQLHHNRNEITLVLQNLRQ